MTVRPLDLTLELAPKARFDCVDLRAHFLDEHQALTGEKPAAPMTCARNDKFRCFGGAADDAFGGEATSNALAE